MYNPPPYKVLLGSTSNSALVNDAIDDGECGTGSSSLSERKIALATEGFTTKFCELVLKDRNRMSQENAL